MDDTTIQQSEMSVNSVDGVCLFVNTSVIVRALFVCTRPTDNGLLQGYEIWRVLCNIS